MWFATEDLVTPRGALEMGFLRRALPLSCVSLHPIWDTRDELCLPSPRFAHVLSMNCVWEHPAMFPRSPSFQASPTRTRPSAHAHASVLPVRLGDAHANVRC